MVVVVERHLCSVELAVTLDVNLVTPVHHHVRDGRIPQQRLQRTEAGHVIDEITDEPSPGIRSGDHSFRGECTCNGAPKSRSADPALQEFHIIAKTT